MTSNTLGITMPPDDDDDDDDETARRRRSDNEILAFSELVHSSTISDSGGDCDNSSLVSLDDERLGLLFHDGDEKPTASGSTICGEEEVPDVVQPTQLFEDDDDSRLADFSPRLVRKYARTLLSEDDTSDENEDGGCCHHSFLLERIKANPALSFATIFMGILTAYIWTDERFRFLSIREEEGNNNHRYFNKNKNKFKGKKNKKQNTPKSYPEFPAKTLLGISIHHKKPNNIQNSSNTVEEEVEPPYAPSDFIYETKRGDRNRTLTYWEEVVEAIVQTQHLKQEDNVSYDGRNNGDDTNSTKNNDTLYEELWANITTWGPCYPRALPDDDNRNHQLRYLRERKDSRYIHNNWTYIVQTNSDQITNEDSIIYPTYRKSYRDPIDGTLGGLCRPGFLIIGQGKCGTSSLYHYLTGHPRVLPAKEKQIHYFRYHRSKPLDWYYSHFPTIESFLGRGALMTGEASPGYMPHPSVVESVVKRLSPNWHPSGSDSDDTNGVEAWKVHVHALPKIIAIVRDPIDRAQSSYKYNYIEPAIKKLKAGRGLTVSGKNIPGGKTEKYYRQHHLFSFEELAYAELGVLKECLAYGGKGEEWTNKRFGTKVEKFFYETIQRRNINRTSSSTTTTAPPLIFLDGACYKEQKSTAVPREQWRELAAEHPDKTLALPNLQLIQSIVGRGIYSFPLAWWYEVFSHVAASNEEERIHVVCTEDMANTPEVAMDDVTKFLGLPEFDFTSVTSVGRYNVGGHRGYDTITRDEDNGEVTIPEDQLQVNQEPSVSDLLAISDALRNELLHFYKPYNERLFRMIGKRCPWNY